MTIKDYVDNNDDFLELLNDPNNVGMINVYNWIMNNPTPEEIKKELPFIEAMGKDENEIKGMDKLDEKQKKRFIQEISFSNFIYKKAIEKLLEKNSTPATDDFINFETYDKLKPIKSYHPLDKITNSLVKIATADEATANLAPPRKTPINIIVDYKNDKINLARPLTAFDIVVHRAVCTLWEAGNQAKRKDLAFNLQDVYQAINGTDNSNINYSVLEQIEISIEQLRRDIVKLDCTELLNAKYWNKDKKPKKAIIDDNILPLRGLKAKMKNNEIINVYKFRGIPPLYEFSKAIGQIANVDKKVLETQRFFSNTKESMIFKEFLIQRIERMKHKKNKTDKNIIYQDVFDFAGIDITILSREQLRRKRENIKQILEYWVSIKYIRSYAEYKEGTNKNSKIIGIEIFF